MLFVLMSETKVSTEKPEREPNRESTRGIDLSILIVHTFERDLVRQTLRALRRASPQLEYEVLVIDNNVAAGLESLLQHEFPFVRYFPQDHNAGFGASMNVGIKAAKGKYVLVFNPDILVSLGALETLFAYMEAHPQVGMVGPQLLNADGTLQYSCYRAPQPVVPILRRTPLGRLPFGQRIIDQFLMKDMAHDQTMEVDWLMGSAMFIRQSVLKEIGGFDERFFMYFEDTDLCRRTWEKGYKVVYLPTANMVHYHRRASADGSLWQQLLNPLTRRHIQSAVKYFLKYARQPYPHHAGELPTDRTTADGSVGTHL